MYKTKMTSDYFTKQGLENRTGILNHAWHIVLLKELIDNALDAIEANTYKEITVEYYPNTLKIFDNGNGLSVSDIKDIYDFENYVTKNRHIMNISRGKLGNGLKTVIGICKVCGYDLSWHTNENIVINPSLDAENAQDGEINIEFYKQDEPTEFKGVEIRGICIFENILNLIVKKFSYCNNDVFFNVKYDKPYSGLTFKPTTVPVNKQSQTSVLFYDFNEFKRLLSIQDGDINYKAFLQNIFGTRIKKASAITSKIKDANINDIKSDFYMLQQLQNKKPLTLMKKHLIGYKNMIEKYPYIIEYEVDNSGRLKDNCVMINNSITYFDASSIRFNFDEYQITTSKTIITANLNEILNAFKDFKFHIHIITPKAFKDFGKTQIDISDIAHAFVDNIRKTINKNKRAKSADKPKNKKDLAFENMDEAFQLASSGDKYRITARQMYYKLRELIGNDEWETEHTYSRFTQDWLTQWLDDNPQYESKVNFSDRGTFIVDGISKGIGSANIRNFIAENKTRKNCLNLSASNNINYHFDFDIRFKYDKALYIEKTGFNEIFLAEGIQEKYNMLIVSGQGYGSRSARQLLYELQQKGLFIYCMHDLDIYGLGILNGLRQANDKFKHHIKIFDLGVTPGDAKYYNISPEKVKINATDLYKLPAEQREYFAVDKEGYSRRVELNAFTTEQLLEILDDKLKNINTLPKLDISKVIEANEQKLIKYALFQLVESKYEKMFRNITLGDTSKIFPATSMMNFYEMQKIMPEIEDKIINKLISQLEKVITQNI